MVRTILMTCSDCRLHAGGWIVSEVEKKFGTHNPYVIALPGPDKPEEWSGVFEKGARVFAGLGSIHIVVVAHEDCAGHRCDSHIHEQDAKKLAEHMERAFPGAPVEYGIARLEANALWRLDVLSSRARTM